MVVQRSGSHCLRHAGAVSEKKERISLGTETLRHAGSVLQNIYGQRNKRGGGTFLNGGLETCRERDLEYERAED